MKYIWQAFGSHSAGIDSFTDVPANADYAAVFWAVGNGITNGTSSTAWKKWDTTAKCTM